jgi:AcrR family transcriptional regulator
MVYNSAALRHIPRQVRGARKVDQILRSAEEVFAEVGYEHATTNAVALRAGVSIGSLYQFFESKDKILEAMAGRYLDQTRVALVTTLDAANEYNTAELMTGLLDTLIKQQEQRPFFLQCLAQNRAYAALSESVAELHAELVSHVVKLLKRILVPGDAGELERRATVCVHAASALLPVALSLHGRERRLMIRETVKLLERYIKPELKVGKV